MPDKRGFTLIELVLAMTIITIFAVLSILAITNSTSGIQLDSAANKLAADLRYAHAMASANARWYCVSFEVSPANRYTVYTTTGTVDSAVENPASLGNNFVVNVAADYNVNISSVDIAGSQEVEFSPLGIPYVDRNAFSISVEGVVTLTKGSSNKTIRITPNTGRIYIQ